MIAHWEQKLTDQIRIRGNKYYKLWYTLAVDLINVYVVLWVMFSMLGWLIWWTVPVTALSAWILTLATQAIVGRDRPKFEHTTGYKMWWRTYSLPSGHATISSAVATVILLQTHFPSVVFLPILLVLFLAVEVLIGIGRMVVGVHYLGDVLVGFVLGVTFGVVFSVL